MDQRKAETGRTQTLAAFIRARKGEILDEWVQIVQRVRAASNLDRPALMDHIPVLLDQVADSAEQRACGAPRVPPIDVARVHALERCSEGYDLTEVVAEYSVLRDCILRMWFAEAAVIDTTGPRALHEAIDQAVAVAVHRFTEARDRTLIALDRIASAAIETRSVDELLDRLLHVFRETTASVDSAAILLRDGDALRVRASVGPELDDPSIKCRFSADLVEAGEIVGAAHMGSMAAAQFSQQDERLFVAMANRATAAIQLHMLLEREQELQRELRERELQLRSVADNMPQLAWIADENASISWYNQRWYDYTGLTWEESRGLGWRAAHHPEHVTRVVDKFLRHMASGAPWEDTFPLRGADGRYRWFLSRATPIRSSSGRVLKWFGTNTDVTEQRLKHETAIVLSSSLESPETLSRVAQLTSTAFGGWCAIEVKEEGGIKRVAVAHTDPSKLELVRDRAVGRKDEHITAPLVVRDQTIGTISVVSADPKRSYTPGDRSLIEQLGRRIALAIDNARLYKEAQREARLREEVLAVVSHDLKSPLGAIHLAASILTEKADPKSRSYLDRIVRAASRMDHMIGDLLDMASIQAGRLAIDSKPESADVILHDVLEIHTPMAREKGITLVTEWSLDGTMLDVDRNRILQVFGNLIGNAIKFCSAGAIITVRGVMRGQEAELSVHDTGPGIPELELRHIFAPYWSARRHAKKGTGLGLYISKGIVEAHHGRIWVESTAGEGAAFYFTMPLAAARQRAADGG